MANGKIRFGKQSGGQLALVIPDGVANTEVVVPESGVLATTQYVDDNTLLSPNDSRVKTALNASGTAPIYACRAWVNFNGTGTVAIRASGNVSSITDNGVGDYTVNFTTAMSDRNYSISANGQADQDNFVAGFFFIRGSATAQNYITTSSVRILASRFAGNGNADIDFSVVNVNVFR